MVNVLGGAKNSLALGLAREIKERAERAQRYQPCVCGHRESDHDEWGCGGSAVPCECKRYQEAQPRPEGKS